MNDVLKVVAYFSVIAGKLLLLLQKSTSFTLINIKRTVAMLVACFMCSVAIFQLIITVNLWCSKGYIFFLYQLNYYLSIHRGCSAQKRKFSLSVLSCIPDTVYINLVQNPLKVKSCIEVQYKVTTNFMMTSALFYTKSYILQKLN